MKFKDAILVALSAVFLQVGFANLIQPKLNKKIAPYIYAVLIAIAIFIIFYENGD